MYLYRAIDRSGALVDVRLSETRDMAAAKALFQSAKAVTGVTPVRITTDGHDGYPQAIRTELGEHVRHRTNRYLNSGMEQDHRGIKADTDRCAGSNVPTQRPGSAAASTNSATSSALVPNTISPFPPNTADCTFSAVSRRRSASYRRHDQQFTHRRPSLLSAVFGGPSADRTDARRILDLSCPGSDENPPPNLTFPASSTSWEGAK